MGQASARRRHKLINLELSHVKDEGKCIRVIVSVKKAYYFKFKFTLNANIN